MSRYLTDEEIDSMVAQDLADAADREKEIKALRYAIDQLSNPLLRRILHKIVDLSQ
jgi:hypothetical protein